MWLMSIPLTMFQYGPGLFSLESLVKDILIERINYIAAIIFVFYVGTLTYVQSFHLIPSWPVLSIKGFIFEYFGRLQLIMAAQSLLFYFIVSVINSPHINDVTINVSNISDVIFNGMLIRFGLLTFISVFVYYVILNESKKQKE